MTKSQDVGGAANSSPKPSQDPGQSNAPDARPQTLSERIDEISSFKTSNQRICSIFRLRNHLDPDEFKKLMEAVDNPVIVGTDLAQVLRDSGYNVPGGTLNRCRKRRRDGECPCR